MAHITADRIQERSWSTGTGPMTLGGAVDAYLPFSARLAASDTCHYLIVAAYNGAVTGEWELGLGTYSAGSLARTAVYASSNADAPVAFAAGQKFVTLVVAAPTTNTAAAWRAALGLGSVATINLDGVNTNVLRGDGTWGAGGGGGGEPPIALGTTAQFWRGDKAWTDFAATVRASVLTGLSLVTGGAIAAADTVLAALGKLQKQITDLTTTVSAKVNRSGDTMTGNLGISPTSGPAYAIITKAASGVEAAIYGTKGATGRWGILLGDQGAETGGNAGSDYGVLRYNDAGSYIDTPFLLTRSNGAALFRGPSVTLTSATASPQLILDSSGMTTKPPYLVGRDQGSTRWAISLGDNTGHYAVHRYNDAGAYVSSPFVINRNTGIISSEGTHQARTFSGVASNLWSFSSDVAEVSGGVTNNYALLANITYGNLAMMGTYQAGVIAGWIWRDSGSTNSLYWESMATSGRMVSYLPSGAYWAASASGFSFTSDERLKYDIQDIEDPIAKFKQIEFKQYRRIGNSSEAGPIQPSIEYGTIAQQVASTTAAAHAVTADGEAGFLGVKPDQLHYLGDAALSVLIDRVEALEARVAYLESK